MPLDVKQKDQFEWPSVLVDNPLTEDTTDRILLLQKDKKSKRLVDMASQVARERTEYREETLSNIASLIEQKIVETLLNGESVITDYFMFEPNIQGSFNSEGEPLDANKVKYSINMSVRPELRNILNNQVKYKVAGLQEQGGAAITGVEDQITGARDGAWPCTGYLWQQDQGRRRDGCRQRGSCLPVERVGCGYGSADCPKRSFICNDFDSR